MYAAIADSPSAAISVGSAPVGQRHQVGRRDGGRLGHAAVAGCHPGGHREPHRLPVDGPDALHARDVRRPRHPEVRRARGAEQVERRDRCRGHPDQHLARRRARARLGRPRRAARRGVCSSTARIVRPAAARSRRSPTPTARSLVPPSGVGPGLVVLVADDELLLGAEDDVAVEVLRALLEQVGDQRPEAGHVEQEVHVRRAEVADVGLPDQLADRPVHRDRVALGRDGADAVAAVLAGGVLRAAAGPPRPASCAS